MKVIEKGKCFVCGHQTTFMIDDAACLFREATCSHCGDSKRNSDVAHAIVQTFTGKDDLALSESLDSLKGLQIYEAQASGKLHDLLKSLPHYVYSEYCDGVPPGSLKDDVRCEDLRRLTFSDNAFDLVITQDVFEHIPDPFRAFREIKRVLKQSGYHIFTVPLHEGHNTIQRAISNETGVVQLKPAVYHGDPLRQEGSLVYTDFGEDIAAKLNAMDMTTDIITYSKWYSNEDITFIDSDESYRLYQESFKSKDFNSFFKYNSSVLISRKNNLAFTGERYVPSVEGQIAYEHLHRYAMACDYVAGKTVLDIASGEGYGSYLLSNKADKVIGVDVSEEAVNHANKKYAKSNLEFRAGSCVNIPCETDFFDVVVSFETIEHLAEHEKMLNELKRVLKKDGILIISSPNKKTYTDDIVFKNEFHVKELYLDEFINLLRSKFKCVDILGQRLTFSSHLWSLTKTFNDTKFQHYFGTNSELDSSGVAPYEALYFIAVCTDLTGISKKDRIISLFTDKNDSLYQTFSALPLQLAEKDRQLAEKDRQLAEKDGQIQDIFNSYSWKITAPLRWFSGLTWAKK